ncbi:hypothetical protein E3J61_03050 [Candidatus Dependentiae bacterium]|nr:MAG: hypothetical protein E3J61_03050 [Candidatus Dependentiae bacterium]
MNYKHIGFLFIILSCSILFFFLYQRVGIKPAQVQIYPDGLGALPCDFILKSATNMPEPLHQEVTRWIQSHNKLVSKLLTIPNLTSTAMLKDFKKSLAAEIKDINLSKHNYIFDINSEKTPAVIKIAGIPSRISSRISSLGYDPHSSKLRKKDDLIYHATRKAIPTQQHIAGVATQILLKQLQSKLISPVNTYLYHIPDRPETCDDNNYIVVQEKLAGYVPFASLDNALKRKFLTSIPLAELYRAIKFANLWDISEDNIWVHEDMDKIAYPDGEKPNNEGYGKNARWKVAVLGHDLDKAKYNIRNWYDGGHRKFEAILKNYSPELVDAWNELYSNDPEVQ